MPRKDSIIWKHFKKIAKGKYLSGKCNYCGETYISNATRMKKHIATKCKIAPVVIKRLFSTNTQQETCLLKSSPPSPGPSVPLSRDLIKDNVVTNIGDTSDSSDAMDILSNQQINDEERLKRTSSSMIGFLDFLKPKDKEKLDELLARAVFATSTPIRIVENPYWKDFFRSIRPAYEAPSRYQLSNSLLDKEYNNIQEQIKIKIENADALTLISDGWTDNTGNSLINILFCTPAPVFFKAVDSKTQSHTGEYIANILTEAMEAVGPNKVNAVITDNAANMRSAWKLLEQKYPHLIICGCLAHGINLFIKDILSIPEIEQTLLNVKEVVKFFKNRQLNRELLKKHQLENGGIIISLALPIDTRWGSNANMLKSLLKTQEHIQSVTVTKEISKIMSNDLRNLILDNYNFWPLVENIYNLLEIPSSAIRRLEGDTPNMSYVHNIITEMGSSVQEKIFFLSESNQRDIVNFFNERKAFIHHPAHLAAHFLNPLLRSYPLDEEKEQRAIDFIINLAQKLSFNVEKIYADIGEYNGKASIWNKESLWKAAELMSPVVWWKGLCGKRELTKVAVILLNLPSTSASSERNWSCFGNIKTAKRNRLTVERTMKLVSIKFNLQLLNGNINPTENRKLSTKNNDNEEHSNISNDDDDDIIDEEFEEILIQMTDESGDNESDELEQED